MNIQERKNEFMKKLQDLSREYDVIITGDIKLFSEKELVEILYFLDYNNHIIVAL